MSQPSRVSQYLREHRVIGKATIRQWDFEETITGRVSAHRGVEIAWLHRGAGEYHIGTKTHQVAASELVMLPATVEHGSHFEAATKCGAIEVSPEFVAHVAEVMAARAAPREITTLPLAACASLVQALEEELALPGPGQIAATEALVEALLLRVLRRSSAPLAKDERVRRAIELIHAEFATELCIDDLAKAAHMSRFHFSRAFRAETGLAPYAYLQRHRVERAAELLQKKRSVTAAAFDSGFRDLGRFARAFRARFGVAPSAWCVTSSAAARG